MASGLLYSNGELVPCIFFPILNKFPCAFELVELVPGVFAATEFEHHAGDEDEQILRDKEEL